MLALYLISFLSLAAMHFLYKNISENSLRISENTKNFYKDQYLEVFKSNGKLLIQIIGLKKKLKKKKKLNVRRR